MTDAGGGPAWGAEDGCAGAAGFVSAAGFVVCAAAGLLDAAGAGLDAAGPGLLAAGAAACEPAGLAAALDVGLAGVYAGFDCAKARWQQSIVTIEQALIFMRRNGIDRQSVPHLARSRAA